MEDYNSTINIICLLLIILTSMALGYLGPSLFKEPKQLNYIFENKSNSDNKLIETFLEIGKNFSKLHNYTKGSYVCVNFSNDFKELIESYNYTVYRVDGCTKNNKSVCHTWIKYIIDYEPITGEFVDYSDKYIINKLYDSEMDK